MEDTTETHTREPYTFAPQSAEIDKLAAALAKAQAKFVQVDKGKTANAGSYAYDYADYGDCMEMLRGPLSEQGLCIIHLTREDVRHGLLLETRLLHASGQWIASEIALTDSGNDQALGSKYTYRKRYSLAIVGLATGKDDDGAASVAASKGAKKSAPAKPAAKKADPAADAKKEENARFWIGLRNIMNAGGIVTDKDAQNKIVRDMMGAAGYEHTADMSNADKAALLQELAELYGPGNKKPEVTQEQAEAFN